MLDEHRSLQGNILVLLKVEDEKKNTTECVIVLSLSHVETHFH